ncbi:hypothetical protein GCM10010187_12810 [Actinomadura coerulea]|nr:hypothetical protein GCM10010187_12810 [Actinomadura coerulea]
MADEYPEFHLHTGNGGPSAHERLLDERGTKRSRQFKFSPGLPRGPAQRRGLRPRGALAVYNYFPASHKAETRRAVHLALPGRPAAHHRAQNRPRLVRPHPATRPAASRRSIGRPPLRVSFGCPTGACGG